MDAQAESVQSYRELLRYTLQEYQTKGGKLTYPVGCYHLEDWLLDALNVPKLLALLQQEREVSLVQACEGGVQGVGNLRSNPSTPNTPGPLAQGVLSAQKPQAEQRNGFAQKPGRPECDLELSLPPTGMSESDLQYLAYTLFVGSCSSFCSEELTDEVREQLQVSASAAESLHMLLGEAAGLQRQAASSLEMVVMLLQLGRPRHFESFDGFSHWRASYAAAVLQSLTLGAAESSTDSRLQPASSLRLDLLRLKMQARMLDVPSSEDFEDQVYVEATQAVVQSAYAVAGASGLGWGLPWAIKIRVAELLMASGFDASNSGTPLEEQQQLIYVLRHHLWPLLSLPISLHDCLHAWAYLRTYAITGNIELLSTGKDLIEAVRQRQQGGMNGRLPAAPHGGSRPNDAEAFMDAMMHSASDWISTRLSAYRQFQDAGPIPALLSVLISCQRCLGQQAHISEVLEKCIQRSVQTEFDRTILELKASSASVPKDTDWIVRVAECCSDLLDEEVSYFSPLFSSFLKRPAEIAATQIHKCFNTVLKPFLQTVHILDDENLEAIRAAVGLESRLQTLLGDSAGEGMSWAILERLTPLLQLWVSNQLSLVGSWYERIMSSEDWQPVSQPRGCARSAVELVKIVRETLEALFGLHLGIPEEVVTAAGVGLDSFLQRYCLDAAAGLNNLEFLIPPIPGLTRYKKDVALKAAALDKNPSKSKNTPRPSRNDSLESNLSRLTMDQERIATLQTSVFLIRVNSLEYIRAQLSALSEIIFTRYGTPEGEDSLWAESMFDNTRATISRSSDIIVSFATTKVVFWEMEDALASVYKHSVGEARINPLLDAIDDKLGSMLTVAEPSVHSGIERALLQAVLDAFIRILLHGGSNRWFRPGDVHLIEEDLELLCDLFHADNEGLPRSEIDAKCTDVRSLLTVLELETSTLVDNLKQVRQQEKLGKMQAKPPLAYDSQVLLHVLAHREDHAASKYLKKEYALPKKLTGEGVFSGHSRSLSSGPSRSNHDAPPKSKSKLSFSAFRR